MRDRGRKACTAEESKSFKETVGNTQAGAATAVRRGSVSHATGPLLAPSPARPLQAPLSGGTNAVASEPPRPTCRQPSAAFRPLSIIGDVLSGKPLSTSRAPASGLFSSSLSVLFFVGTCRPPTATLSPPSTAVAAVGGGGVGTSPRGHLPSPKGHAPDRKGLPPAGRRAQSPRRRSCPRVSPVVGARATAGPGRAYELARRGLPRQTGV